MQPDERPAPDPTADRSDPAEPAVPPAFRLAVVPGVNPAKWLRVWEQRLPDVPIALVQVSAREAEEALRSGRADAGLVRVPVDRATLSAIPLYTETTVVVVPTGHLVAAADEVTAADLADDVLLVPRDDVLAWVEPPGEPSALPAPVTTADAVDLVAAGVGVIVVPQSLARLHHRRDLTHRPVTDAPTSTVGLAWVTEGASDLVEELIGIVRGRTVNSSRGRGTGTGQAATPDAGNSSPAAPSTPDRRGRVGSRPRTPGSSGSRAGAPGSAGTRRTGRRTGGARPGGGRRTRGSGGR